MLSPLSSSSITSITSDSDGNPILSYIDPSTGHTLSRSFPAVIVATTTRSMQMIALTSSTADHGGSILEPVVKVAIRNVHHMDSSKMFIRTQTKFWKVDPTIPQNIQMDELPRGVYSYEFSDKCVHEPVFGGERLSSQDVLLGMTPSHSHPLSHCL